ncbi:MAG TPA: hypothetical protein VMS32_07180, partial [Verrucomicrobiae bacterium]|jgi:post-segregation antitoxin (ccd killing protein)|nr:hypothetical protein [Verrucomicrobiae bacterium]
MGTPAKAAQRAVKRSVTFDPQLDAQAHALVGNRGFSALVNDALRSELQHRRLQHWLDEETNELGPIPEVARVWARKAWDDTHR